MAPLAAPSEFSGLGLAGAMVGLRGRNMSEVERTSAGLQTIIPGCERRTLPKSTTRVDEGGQGLLHFYKPPTLREKLEIRSDALLRSNKGQKALPKSGLFSS